MGGRRTKSGRAEPLATRSTRPDPVDVLLRQEQGRLPWLLPVRHARMAESSFAYFRGAAAMMAEDLSALPHTGLEVQLCGDAHLMNFGFYASPERSLVFDINDFDETHRGPFDWDIQRLAASLVVAARSQGFGKKHQELAARRSVEAYSRAMAGFAAASASEVWFTRLDIEGFIARATSRRFRKQLRATAKLARHRDSRRAVKKLCVAGEDRPRQFRHDPPLVWRHAELAPEWRGHMDVESWIGENLSGYLSSIRPEIRQLLSRFRIADTALKAVGVGSVGTRCAIGLFLGEAPDDILVLQSKEAEPSVLAPHWRVDSPAHQGQRVIEGQRLMQTVSDVFLGWTTAPSGQQFYWRHFRDWKCSLEIEDMNAESLVEYGELCAWVLAKAHARSGDPRAIAETLRREKNLAPRFIRFALDYAEVTESDHRALLTAIESGRIEAGEAHPAA
jgi:uncharacterized protein (DUF2252 family)